MARRGALIVLEGCDRVGKSTQCQKLFEALNSSGKRAEKISFPSEGPVHNHAHAFLRVFFIFAGKNVTLQSEG